MTPTTIRFFKRLLAGTRKVSLLLFVLFAGTTVRAQYCASGATSTFDSNVGAVVFNTINNATTGLCATYSDFSNLSTNVTIGNNYNISVTLGTCGGNFDKYGKVYIDYNGDGDFVDPGEEVWGFGPINTPQVSTTNITIPVTAVLGTTRMRVVGQETFQLTNVMPCGTFTWGETEDYTVVIMPSSPNDLGVTAINSPSSGCNLSAAEQVSIDVTNFGTNTQTNWNVNYRINAGPVVTESMAQSLPSGASATHTFATTANLSVPGTYTIQSWTTLATDTVPINDTSTVQVISVPGVTTYPYVENFESGNGGWISGGNLNSWAFGTPAKQTIIGAASGVNAWVTGGLGQTDYNNNEDSYIIGPCFDFSTLTDPWVSLSIWWNSEFSWDGTNLQYSTDFGLTWNNVGAYLDPGNWYNDNTITGNPGGSQEGWCGRTTSNNGSNGWITAAHRLDGLGGLSSVRLRFTFGSDGSVTDDGIGIDDVRIGEGPTVNLGPDQLLCAGDSIFLNAGSFASYQWSTGGGAQIDTITAAQTGTIAVQVTDTNGFFTADTMLVSLSAPIVNLGPDTTICPGDTMFFNAGSHPGGNFAWSNGDTTQIVGITTQGNVWVNVTDSVGCPATDTAFVTLAIPPMLDLGNDTTVCANQPVSLNAGNGPAGTTYQWSTGASTQVIVVTSSGMYAATVTTPGGCGAVDSVEVFNNPTPGVSLGLDRTECQPYTLDAGPGGSSYLWSTGATTQTITLSTGGTYHVTVTNSFGCTASDTVSITYGALPPVALGNDTTLCNGQSVTLDAGNAGSTYFWSTGATTQTITVSNPGIYIVLVTDPNGCVGSDTISIGGSNLSVNLGPDTDICGSNPVILDAGNVGQAFAWSTGATTQQISVNTPGTYTVTVTDQLGCSASDDIVLGMVPGMNAGINAPASGNLFFNIQFNDASSPAPSSWIWDFGDGATSTLQNPTHAYSALAVYTVTLIADDGFCRDTTTHQIDIDTFIGIGEDDFASDLELYPNPSDGFFHLGVELYRRKDLRVEVLDLNGRRMFEDFSKATMSYKNDLDLRHLAKGVYVLRLSTPEASIYEKLIIQ